MAYIDQTQDPRRRATAITGVVLVHTAIALALLSLGVVGSPDIEVRLKGINPTPDPIPLPPPPPTPPEPTPTQRDRPVSPPLPPIPTWQDPGDRPVEDSTDLGDLPIFDNTPIVRPTPTPRPTPSFTPKGAVPSAPPSSWISTDDYPAGPLRREIEGVASYKLIVGSTGRVSSCEVTLSTGNRELDLATCRLISRRARFAAATDGSGASVVGNYSGTVRWEIPD